MTITAVIPTGQTEVTVNGLHQWDYGQKLEIHDDTLPALVEIHFACAGMDEAVVRSSASVEGVSSAVIPDQCLEQVAPVVAWVYGIDGTSGQTLRTVVMPVMQRTKPAPAASVPTYISNQYTELISAISEQIAALQKGNVTVSHASIADKALLASSAAEATHALRADNASAADYAGQAGEANKAKTAETASHASTADNANAAEVLHPRHISPAGNKVYIDRPGVYAVVFISSDEVYFADMICVPLLSKMTSSNHVLYSPDDSRDGGVLESIYGEEIGGYSIYTASMLASYPEG